MICLIESSMARGSFRSANRPACVALSLANCLKLSKPDCSHVSFKNSLTEAAQTGQLKFLHRFWLSGIPPAAAGGSFNPGLQGARNALESHRRQPVDRSIPARASNNGKQSLGLNNPPAAAGGILVNITCVETLAVQFALLPLLNE